MGFYVNDTAFAVLLLLIILFGGCLYLLHSMIGDQFVIHRERIKALAEMAQQAELRTRIPYYTGSGPPIDHKLEECEQFYMTVSYRYSSKIYQ